MIEIMKLKALPKLSKITQAVTFGLFSMGFAQGALADSQDTLNFIAGISQRYDDNLFRTVNNAQSDRSTGLFVGITLDKQYSLQRFRARATVTNNRYNKNSYLDYTAKAYDVAWLWALTPRLTGTLAATRDQSLNNFNDTQTTTQNIRTTETQTFLADYNPGGGWHVLAGFSRQELENSQTFTQDQSFTTNAADVGIKYIFPSNSSITLMNHVRKGKFDNQFNAATLTDDGFKEYEQEVILDWSLTPKSTVKAVASYLKRENDNFSERDYSGFQGTLNYNWLATAKITVGLNLNSRLENFQTDVDSYARTNTLSLTPRYAITPKININANVSVAQRKFLGRGFVQPTGSSRLDDQKTAGIGVSWAPTLNSSVGVNFQHFDLDSNVDTFDYTSNSATLSGNILF